MEGCRLQLLKLSVLDSSKSTWKHWYVSFPLLIPSHILVFLKEELTIYQAYIHSTVIQTERVLPRTGERCQLHFTLRVPQTKQFIQGHGKKVFSIEIFSVRIKKKCFEFCTSDSLVLQTKSLSIVSKLNYCPSGLVVFFFFNPHPRILFIDLRESEMSVGCLPYMFWGWNPHSRCVPWLGIEPATFWCMEQRSNRMTQPGQFGAFVER